MPLESTMICLDNSEWMRNGDYIPTRFAAQQDAASVVCTQRLNDNPESTVGILTMAGQGVDLLVSPTEEPGKVLAAFAKVKIGGKSDLTTSIQIAQLALKHRKNKNGGQRIIVFLGGPISESSEALQKIAKQLKKNNVALDVVVIGEEENSISKVQELVDATNANDNSHLIVVPAGVSATSALQSSPLMYGSGAAGAGGGAGMGGGDDFDMYGGIDPTMDPELAMAIRISQEEARAQEEARSKAQAAPSSSSGAAPAAAAEEEEDEETLIQRALEMSMMDMGVPATAAPSAAPEAAQPAPLAFETGGDEEDEELQRALALSMAGADSAPSVNFSDPNFVNQLLSGADTEIQQALEQIQQEEESKEKDEKGKKRKSDDL